MLLESITPRKADFCTDKSLKPFSGVVSLFTFIRAKSYNLFKNALTFQHLDSAFDDLVIAHKVSFLDDTKSARPKLLGDFKITPGDFWPLSSKTSWWQGYS